MKQLILANNLVSIASLGLFRTHNTFSGEYLAHTPAVILANYLTTQDLISNPSDSSAEWPFYIGFLPDILHNTGVIYDVEGVTEGRYQKTGTVVEHQGVKIVVTSKIYNDGWSKINQLVTAINLINDEIVTIDDSSYKINGLVQQAPVDYIGIDEKRKFNFTVDYLINIQYI